MFSGAVLTFLAEALAFPTGILIAALLTRHLGAEGYGLFALAATPVIWMESLIVSLFADATVKLISETNKWEAVATTALRLYAIAGVGTMLLLWLLASPIATLLNDRALASVLFIFALDVPIFCLVQAHRSILIATGGFNQRALAGAVRWISRLLLIALFVELGLSVTGAILGCIGASVMELVIIRLYIRPRLLGHSDFPFRGFQNYAAALLLSNLSMNLFERLDLFMLQWLGGATAMTGIYGAAQTLSTAPSIITAALVPPLLSTQSRMFHAGEDLRAKEVGEEAMRVVTWLIPLAAVAVGAAPEIVTWIYGADFAAAALPFACLIFAQSVLVMRWVMTAGLIAAGKPSWTSALTGPMVPLAVVAHLVMIPRLGALGASLVTAAVAGLGVTATLLAVRRLLQVVPPWRTFARSIVVAGLAYIAAAWWPAVGAFLVVKLLAIGLGIMLLFFVLGEFTARDLRVVRELVRRRAGGVESRDRV